MTPDEIRQCILSNANADLDYWQKVSTVWQPMGRDEWSDYLGQARDSYRGVVRYNVTAWFGAPSRSLSVQISNELAQMEKDGLLARVMSGTRTVALRFPGRAIGFRAAFDRLYKR